LIVEVSTEELKIYLPKAVEHLSREVKIEGFRPGKATYEVLKAKIGEMAIWEEAARDAINKTFGQALEEKITEQVVGQPEISITKLATDNPLEYKAVVTILPEIILAEYKNFGIEQVKVEITTEEVQKTLNELREWRAKEVITDRAIGEGDKVIVDINMSLDKVPVEGGQTKDTAVIMGKNYIIPGFDQHLIGAKKNDNREFTLHYPEDHHQKNLAGKQVEFNVTIKEVYERKLPALDDDMATAFGMKKLTELEADIKKTIEKDKEQQTRQKVEIQILDKLIEETKFGDIPELLILNEGDTMLHELEHDITERGAKFEDYLQSLNKTPEQIKLEMMPQAVKRVKSALIIREISKKENITASDHDVEHEIEHILEHYPDNKEVEKQVTSKQYKEYLRNSISNRKVIEKLREWNVVKK